MFDKLINKIYAILLRISNFLGLENKNESELQLKLAQIITNSLDPEELKNKIVREIAIALKAWRCFFIEYDSATNNFKKISNCYRTNRSSISQLGYDIEKETPRFAMKLKYVKTFVVNDIEKYIKEKKLENSREADYYKKFDVKSSISLRLEFGESFLGVLVVHYDRKNTFLKYTDLEFLKNLAEHISIALHLSTLYVEEKREKERERLLRSIISIMGEGYNLGKITQKIFEILGNLYSAEELLINIDTESYNNSYLYNLSKAKTGKILEVKEKALEEAKIYDLPVFELIKSQFHYIPDTHNFVIQNNLENTAIEKHFIEHNIKSMLLSSILHENFSFGFLVIHFDRPNTVAKEDLTFIESVINQLAIAIKQIKNYVIQKRTAERATLLSKITETIRSSLDIEETLAFISEETANLFNVQRTTIATFPTIGNYENFNIRKEYKVSSEINGLKHSENTKNSAMYWGQSLVEGEQIIAIDNIEESNTPDYFKNHYGDLGIKSIIGTSIRKGQNVWGILVLSEYNRFRHWTDSEKILLMTIADQVYIAINQAELFEKERKTAERERILIEIISKIRSSLDYDDTLSYICRETAKLFNVQRSSIVTLPNRENFSNYIVEQEYKTDPRIKGLAQAGDFSKVSEYLWTHLVNDSQILAIDNISESDAPEDFKNAYFSIGVKSVIAISIKENENVWGSLVLSEYDKVRKWTEDEKILLTTIANQVYLAIHQAQLFKKEKETAETERFNRKILEILRNNLDIETISNLFVRNIGKYFKADRVFFSRYDSEKHIYLPVEEKAEYLSSPIEKSFVGTDWTDPSINEYIQPLLDKREFKIFCWDDYLKNNPKSNGFISLFESASVKSSYNFPVVYEGKIMGFFCIEFTQGNCKTLSDEDIKRIRSLCSQAGIALYHSELFYKLKNQ